MAAWQFSTKVHVVTTTGQASTRNALGGIMRFGQALQGRLKAEPASQQMLKAELAL